MRSLAAESDRAYQNGPLERTFYQEASLSPEERAAHIDLSGIQLPNQYTSRLDWFAVDLEGEHSAMDGAILEAHTEYVVYAIHKVSLLSFLDYVEEKQINNYDEVAILMLFFC